MDIPSVIEVGAVSTLLLQGIKWIIRRVKKQPEYDFPPNFYYVLIPVLNILVTPVLAIIGFEGFMIPTDWQGWVMGIVRVLIASLVSLIAYSTGLKPLKSYATYQRVKHLG